MMIPLDRIIENPKNPNAMKPADFKKLHTNIKRTKNYPPLIVRPLDDGRYMLIDGQHRRHVLLDLGYTEANCDVWNLSDKEADVALATLNRLHGTDDPRKRAELVDVLASTGLDSDALAMMLPETAAQIEDLRKLMAVDADVVAAMERVLAPEPLEAPVLVTFALYPGQWANVRKALDHLLHAHELEGAKNADAQALEFMAIEYLSGVDADADAERAAEGLAPIGSAG